jgi:arylsulfatase A-like enzyme
MQATTRYQRTLTFLSVLAGSLALQAAPRPNIVHILVDDLGWQDIAAHRIDGDAVYDTPHLDRMTREGRRFTQAYSPAPTCAPSRVSFLRGRYPVHTGVYHVQGGRLPRPWRDDTSHIPPYYPYGLPDEEPTIADVLGKAGYMTGHVGKWHAGGKHAGYPFPLDQGFAFGFSEHDGRHKYYNDADLWNPEERIKNQFFGSWGRMHPDRLSDFATAAEEDPFQTDADGRPFDKPHDLAMGFIRKHKDKPFFLNYCPYYVHGPIQTRDRVRFEKYLQRMGYDFPTDPAPLDKGKPGHTNPYYASMVDTLDHLIGGMIRYLEETDDPRNPGHKLIENTYVIVDSDNGGVLPYTDNAPLRGGKQNSYEGGVRIPFLVLGPGVPAGTECHTPISLVDLFPTFMEIAGAEQDPALELDGCNILAQLRGGDELPAQADGSVREAIFWHFPMDSHMSVAMRKGPWKLVRNFGVRGGGSGAASVELFRIYDENGAPADLSEEYDVGEQHPELREALAAEISAYLEEAGAGMPYRNGGAKKTTQVERAAIPRVTALSADGDRVMAAFETSEGKSAITEATLYYTLNPEPYDSTGGHREEWFPAPAELADGKVAATMPPGATHAAFVMRDAEGFLVTSEPLPSYQQKDVQYPDSQLLANGFAWRPGLHALVKLGGQARASAIGNGLDTAALDKALAAASGLLAEDGTSTEAFANGVRALRKSIRELEGIEEAAHPCLNRFPTEPLF